MPLTCAIFGCGGDERQTLEAALQATGKVVLNPIEPDVAVVELPRRDPEAALGKLAALRTQMPQAHLIAVGALDPPQLIVAAMRAGANEYLEAPVRPEQLDEALARCQAARAPAGALRTVARGKLIAVLGARGGCGATTVAVNLALSLHGLRRQADAAVALLDLAPLGHAALHLNLKPQYTVADLLAQSYRLDAALLDSLMVKHASGLRMLAGPSAPLAPTECSPWMDMLLQHHPVVVADLSARLDGLTRSVLELADRILFVSQTDMVSLWSAAKVRQHLDAAGRMKFEMVLNRYTPIPAGDLAGIESITKSTVLCKLPNAHALVSEAIERGEPVVTGKKSDLARGFGELATAILGRAPERKRGWIPFLRTREVAN